MCGCRKKDLRMYCGYELMAEDSSPTLFWRAMGWSATGDSVSVWNRLGKEE